ncbi:MAG: 2OG-Fe(II) oxygenase [Halioglobus sp.]
MDSSHVATLRSEADKGNPVAERLLLQHWLANGENDAISELLQSKRAAGHALHARFLEAELSCFHGWETNIDWREVLHQCSVEGHPEASFVDALYRDWATHLNTTGSHAEEITADGDPYSWQPPTWHTLAHQEGLSIEQSSPFAPKGLLHFICSHLGRALQPSAVIDPESGQPVMHPVRHNQSAQWLPEQLGWAGKLVEQRLAQAAEFQVNTGEVLSLLHYQPGQQYKAHYDCLSDEQAHSPQGIAEGGQRTLTVLLTLGDANFTGGATHFPKLGVSARPQPGELLRFNNTDEHGKALACSLHEGQPIESGEKWLLSKWVRESNTPYGRELALT